MLKNKTQKKNFKTAKNLSSRSFGKKEPKYKRNTNKRFKDLSENQHKNNKTFKNTALLNTVTL
jgi:hypothetical protein